jgi:hypothetical protein
MKLAIAFLLLFVSTAFILAARIGTIKDRKLERYINIVGIFTLLAAIVAFLLIQN